MRLVFLILYSCAAFAQEDHSRHQHAVAGLGTVDFPVSCNADAQAKISRAVALLHSFGYEEARLAFADSAKADPRCAMAYWGIARTWYHPVWAPPTPAELRAGAEALQKAVQLEPQSGRERDYIDALGVFYERWESVDHKTRARNYERALARVSERNPSDDEAAIFHALQLVALGYMDPADKTYAWQRKGSEILNRLLPTHQDHPGVAHYIIHAVDCPPLAELGLKAARSYAAIAPDSPHALHMPSHIFTRLGMWDDSIASNIASSRSAVARAQRMHGGGGSFDQLHAVDYLVYAYLQEGRDTSARKLLDEMDSITRLDAEDFAAAYAFAASPARWALERHDWKAAAALEVKPAWFSWSRYPNAEALVHYARAIGAARGGDLAEARRSLAKLEAIRKALPATPGYDWSASIAPQSEAANALIVWEEGRKQEGIRLLRIAADHEDAVEKSPVTPGALLPAREMLADLLLENGAAADALKEYETVLKTAPRRLNSFTGAAAAAEKSGDRIKARAYAGQLKELTKSAEPGIPRPH